MARPSIMRALAMAMGFVLALSTMALASDAANADGDTADGVFEADADGPNDATQFGDVCPGGTYTREVRLAVRRLNNTAPNSFANDAVVTWGFFPPTVDPDPSPGDGAQEVDPAYGHLSATYVGTQSMTMPGNWQTRATDSLWPTGTTSNPYIKGLVTLSVPVTAPPGDPNGATSNGSALWRASGTRTSGNQYLDRSMGNHWNVLDGDDYRCDQAGSAAAAFEFSHVACGAAVNLVVTPNDPDAAVTSEDGLTLDIDWGAGTPTHVEGVKGNTPLTFAAPYTTAGSYTATVTWTDSRIGDAATTGSTTATVAVDYDTSGILQPINKDGSSIFKSNSTIPAKVRFTDCDGSVPSDLAPTIRFVRTSGAAPVTGAEETPLSTSAHTDGEMRFSDGQWIYNLSGKSLPDPSAAYRLVITVPETGQQTTADFGLKA